MMLVAGVLRVALASTHLPLREVPAAINRKGLEAVLRVLHHDLPPTLRHRRPAHPGLRPQPACRRRRPSGTRRDRGDRAGTRCTARRGHASDRPLPADTLFTPRQLAEGDAVLAMYHDQGLPVLKHAGFGEA